MRPASIPLVPNDLFDAPIRMVTTTLDHSIDALHPDERAVVARAVTKRQREFAAGRWCAHTLLAELGFDVEPLLPGRDRAPQWPNGAVGSISHCRSLCAAAVALRRQCVGIGLDVEDQTPLERRLWRLVVGQDELSWVLRPDGLEAGLKAKLLFSAKECLYKCQYPVAGLRLEFTDVHIEVDADRRTFEGRILEARPVAGLPSRLEGRFVLTGSTILTGMAIHA